MTSDNTALEWDPDRDAQARGWLVRLKSGGATQGDLDGLARWRAQSDENEQSFRRAVHLWEMIGPATSGGLSAVPPAGRGVSRRWVLGGAGGLALSAAVALTVGGAPTPAGARVFETRKGERERFVLDAHASVDLNTDSRLFYWADPLSPRVVLDRGEAIISASYGGDQYLAVEVKDVSIRAQAARVLIRDGDADVRVACLDGRVSLQSAGKGYALASGEDIRFQGGAALAREDAVNVNDVAWQNNLLQFRDRPAGQVIEELNRYRPGRVYLMGDKANVRITGVIHLERTDAAVDHIAQSLGMKVIRLPGGIAILRAT